MARATHTQDLAAPLPVVLQSKTGADATQYLYALGTRPLAQNGGAWEYLLPDALGSVRQIADANGNVTLAESYEPYGSVLNSSGSASSIFGFSGEQVDTYIKLLFLRARYMNPTLGIFLARDPWSGDELRPGSMNGFNYSLNNPVNITDPSGQIPGWPPEVLDRLQTLKPFILVSASRHNTPLTNMDDRSFAALMAAILRHERLLSGLYPDNALYELFHDKLPDLAGAILGRNSTTGIANIRPSTALELLEGIIPGVEGTFCYNIQEGPDYNSLLMLSGMSAGFGPNLSPTQILFNSLQEPRINIEYLAANLQRGAVRITRITHNIEKASAFNLATWHTRGVQTPREFTECTITDRNCGRDAIQYAKDVLGFMRGAFEALFGPGATGVYLEHNQQEEQYFSVPPQ